MAVPHATLSVEAKSRAANADIHLLSPYRYLSSGCRYGILFKRFSV